MKQKTQYSEPHQPVQVLCLIKDTAIFHLILSSVFQGEMSVHPVIFLIALGLGY